LDRTEFLQKWLREDHWMNAYAYHCYLAVLYLLLPSPGVEVYMSDK
jgi:hypothetical protein